MDTKSIRIADMEKTYNVKDSDRMIVEDEIDTKQTTVAEVKRCFNGDNKEPSSSLFYSSIKTDSLLRNTMAQISAQTNVDIKELYSMLNNVLSTTAKAPLPKGFMAMDLEEGKEAEYSDWFGGVWECIGHVDLGVENHVVNAFIYQKVDGIEYPDSVCTQEIVAARGEYDSLSERFVAERHISDAKYMQYPVIEQTNSTVAIINKGKNIQATLIFKGLNNKTFSFTKETVNLFDKNNCIGTEPGIITHSTGFTVFMKTTGLKSFKVKINPSALPAGTYYLYHSMDNKNGATGFTYDIIYTDGTYDTVTPRMNMDVLEIKARKAFSHIKFNILGTFTNTPIGDATKYLIKFDGFMITRYDKLLSYSPYEVKTTTHTAQGNNTDVEYIITCPYDTIFKSTEDFTVKYVDTSYSESTVDQVVKDINNSTESKVEYCGLMENYGTYIYLDDMACENEEVGFVKSDKKMMRNYNNSARITIRDYNATNKPTFIKTLESITDFSSVEYVSLQLYIDRTLYSNFNEADGITMIISSDKNIYPINYYTFNFGRGYFVQGWNNIKIPMHEFTKVGSPDIRQIRQIVFKVATNKFTSGSTFWINSIVLNQRMTPTILLAFDGVYSTGFDYQYPLLYTRGIPATIFLNNRDTWNKEIMGKLCTLLYQYGWDIGDYGCNPDKELLIKDDNPREQYLALKSAKDYIVDNYTNAPISYSAALGNLRPITMPILKELGFSITKTDEYPMCSFFGQNDFTLGALHMNNTVPADQIISAIDNAVDTEQSIVIYTHNITEYGDNSSMSRASFEKVINHILELMASDKAQCMTFKEFYSKCTEQ